MVAYVIDTPEPITVLRYVLLINAAPQSGEAANSALRFAGTLLEMGHHIERLFFYGDGVITPAISVVSAVDGLKIATPALQPYIVWISIAIIISIISIVVVVNNEGYSVIQVSPPSFVAAVPSSFLR